MQIEISGHHLDITPALRDYVFKKLQPLEHHFSGIYQVKVILTSLKAKIGKKADANLHYAGHDLHASALDDDLYAAIDSMTDKLHRQAVTQKEKHNGE